MIVEFFSKNKRLLFSAAAILMMGVLLKHKVYDRIIPSSDIMGILHKQQFRKVGYLLINTYR